MLTRIRFKKTSLSEKCPKTGWEIVQIGTTGRCGFVDLIGCYWFACVPVTLRRVSQGVDHGCTQAST
jgi:hypothetical protein